MSTQSSTHTGPSTFSQNIQGKIVQPQHQLISIKPNDSNHLLWKHQVLTAIRGYGLESFISNTQQIPNKISKNSETSAIEINPEYLAWCKQDQLLASWLLSSLSENLLVMMVGLETSLQIWEALETSFATQSSARKMQYKLQLSSIKKGSLSMRDYLNKVKSCCDSLASAGLQVSEDDQILQILSGLGSEFDPVVVAATSRVEGCKLRELYSMLLSFETRLESSGSNYCWGM